MTRTRPSGGISFSEAEWRRFLISERPRPNLLILCAPDEIESVVARVMSLCTGPVHGRRLPGELALPDALTGTLLLWDVAQLTLGQQIALHDWITERPQFAQVISVSSSPLLPLVQDGQFLEGLFYRMNIVSFVAKLSAGGASVQVDTRMQVEGHLFGRGLRSCLVQ